MKEQQENPRLALAELIRKACVEAAREGYEDASISGLCAEGALEAALSSIERLDLQALLKAQDNQ